MSQRDITFAACAVIAAHGPQALTIAVRYIVNVRELGLIEKAAWWESVALAIKKIQRSDQIRRWRLKAEEIRTAADGFADTAARGHMRNSAETYEALANALEARLERKKETEFRRRVEAQHRRNLSNRCYRRESAVSSGVAAGEGTLARNACK